MQAALVLDDDEMRHMAFARELVPSGWIVTHAFTVDQMRDALERKEGAFDLVTMDYDLSDESEGRTGYDAAELLVQLPKKKWPTQVVIHSRNPFGSWRMYRLLDEAGMNVSREPF